MGILIKDNFFKDRGKVMVSWLKSLVLFIKAIFKKIKNKGKEFKNINLNNILKEYLVKETKSKDIYMI